MTVEEWPVAAPGSPPDLADRSWSAGASPGAADRIAAVRAEFFLDPDVRLTEQERALMTAMLHGLVGEIADELRVRLPYEVAQESECGADQLVAQLGRTRLLAGNCLLELLVRRTDAVRIAQVATGTGISGGLVPGWSGDEDPEVAAAAMALVIARGRARDRYGRPNVALADCPAEVAVELVHAVAAALARRCPGRVDPAFAGAAIDLLSRHDEGQNAQTLEARLVRSLEAAGHIDNDLALALAQQGEAGLMAECLARLAGVEGADAWSLLVQPGGAGLPLLLRLAGTPRSTAAALFADVGEAFGAGDAAAAIDRLDGWSAPAIERERERLRLPEAYRQARQALNDHG